MFAFGSRPDRGWTLRRRWNAGGPSRCLPDHLDLLVTWLLSRLYFISRDDDLLGGMWAVIATIFVNRASYQQSWTAAVSRTTATFLSPCHLLRSTWRSCPFTSGHCRC